MCNLHIRRSRLKQLHLVPAKQRRERDIHLRLRQIHPYASSCAAAKRRQLLHQFHGIGLQPAVRIETFRLHEDGRFVVHIHVFIETGVLGGMIQSLYLRGAVGETRACG